MAPPHRTPLRQISGNGKINSELTPAERNQIIGAALCGVKKSDIATHLDYHRNTVLYTLKKATERPPFQASITRSGRPKVLSAREKRSLIRTVKKEPKTIYEQLKTSLGLSACKNTLQAAFKEANIACWRAKRRPELTAEHATKRLAWALEHVNLPDAF